MAFAEWAAMFSERIIVVLKVYADESETPGPQGQRTGPDFKVIRSCIFHLKGADTDERRWKTFGRSECAVRRPAHNGDYRKSILLLDRRAGAGMMGSEDRIQKTGDRIQEARR